MLLETEIGQPLKRIVRVGIPTDTTNSQSPPYYVVFKTRKGGWMPYEMDPEEYKKVMAEVSFEATAGATAPKTRPETSPKPAADNGVHVPRTAPEQCSYAGPRLKTTPRRSEYSSLVLRCKPSWSWAGGVAVKPSWAGGDDSIEAVDGGGHEAVSVSGSDSDSSSSRSSKKSSDVTPPKPPQRVRGGAPTATNRGADVQILADASPDNKVQESPTVHTARKALPLPKVSLCPSKEALLAHMSELLAALKQDTQAAKHPSRLFNEKEKPTHDLYAVRGPRAFVKRLVRSYCPLNRPL